MPQRPAPASASADPGVRAAALGALERLAVADDSDVAVALGDVDPAVRRRAATIAARHPGVALLETLDDTDPMVAEVAAWACGEREDVDDVVFVRLVCWRRRPVPTRSCANRASQPSGRSATSGGSTRSSRRPPTGHRFAAEPCSPWRRSSTPPTPAPSEVDSALHRALEDRDWQVRQAAEDLL